MTQQARERILAGGIVVAVAAAALWGLDGMMQKRGDARRAAADLAECRNLARALAVSGRGPTARLTVSAGSQRLSKQIQVACDTAAILYPGAPGEASLDGTFPQTVQRVGDGHHLLVPTLLPLRNVPLPQLAAFLYHLTSGTEFTVRDLRLRVPRGEVDGEVWDAEATVTYLVDTPAQD